MTTNSKKLIAAIAIGLIGAVFEIACLKDGDRAKVVSVSAETCRTLAKMHNRDDIALACDTAEDLAPIIEALLKQTEKTDCVIEAKDAGVQEAEAPLEDRK